MASTPCTPQIRPSCRYVTETAVHGGMIINIGAVLATLRKLLGVEMTIAEWIGTAALTAIPYLVIGMLWTLTHIDHLNGLGRVNQVASLVVSVISWPVLLFTDVCVA
jgi:hypothetical protein